MIRYIKEWFIGNWHPMFILYDIQPAFDPITAQYIDPSRGRIGIPSQTDSYFWNATYKHASLGPLVRATMFLLYVLMLVAIIPFNVLRFVAFRGWARTDKGLGKLINDNTAILNAKHQAAFPPDNDW